MSSRDVTNTDSPLMKKYGVMAEKGESKRQLFRLARDNSSSNRNQLSIGKSSSNLLTPTEEDEEDERPSSQGRRVSSVEEDVSPSKRHIVKLAELKKESRSTKGRFASKEEVDGSFRNSNRHISLHDVSNSKSETKRSMARSRGFTQEFDLGKNEDDHKEEEEQAAEEEAQEERVSSSLLLGVSLQYLRTLPIDPFSTFTQACEYVKQLTKSQTGGDRSFARYLQLNPLTQHVVKRATHFVSYAWAGTWLATMNALEKMFQHADSDPFLWMDFAVMDQYETDRDFDAWANSFKHSLQQIGKAIIVLTPAENPIATSRAWCCYEWYSIVQAEIPFDYCVNPQDEIELKKKMKTGEVGFAFFNNLFSKINVEKAEAYNQSDAVAILHTLKEFGIVDVNDIVMLSVKEWLLGLVQLAQNEVALEDFEEMVCVLTTRAALHKVLGEWELAESFYAQAEQVSRRNPTDESSLAALLNNRALLMSQTGKISMSEKLFQESLQLQAKRFGEDHPEYAQALSNRAQLYSLQGDFQQAERLTRRALLIFRNCHQEEKVALTCNNLAGLLLSEGGHLEEAKTYYLEAITLWRKVLGNDHPQLATGLNNLSALYRDTNELDLAMQLLEESMGIRQKVYGDNHPEVALCLNNSGQILTLQGKFEEAERMYRQAVVIDMETFGLQGVSTMTALNNLAQLFIRLRNRDKLKEAEEILLEICTTRKSVLGEQHVDYATSLCDLGKVYMELKQVELARQYFQQAIEIWESQPQGVSRWVATAYNNLGLLEFKVNARSLFAKTLFSQAIEIWKKFNGPTHPQVALGLANLAMANGDSNLYLEAIDILRQQEHNLNNKRYEMQVKSNLLQLYLETNRLELGEKLLQELMEPGMELLTNRPLVFQCFLRMRQAELFFARRKYVQAMDVYKRLLVREAEIGESDRQEDEFQYRLGLCLVQVGSVSEAEEYFNVALKNCAVAKRKVLILNELAQLKIEENAFEKALALLHQIVGLEKDDLQALHNLALVLTRLQRFEESETHYRRILALDQEGSDQLKNKETDLATDWTNLSICLARQGKFEEAEHCCRQALILDKQVDAYSLNVARDLFSLAQHLYDQNNAPKLEEAKVCGKESLHIYRDKLKMGDDEEAQQVESFLACVL